jgi:PAS domain S-box-containing protein
MVNISKILLLENEEEIRRRLQQYLHQEGYEVSAAKDGEKGIELFQREKPSIVLTGIKMPRLNGIGVLRRIKQLSPETEVIVMTGPEETESAIESFKLDASDVIFKPVVNATLSLALRRARERIDTKRLLKEYTNNLENKVKEAVEALKESYEFETNLINHSIDGIIATDKQGKIVIFNQGAERIFGYSKDAVIGQMDIQSLYPPGIKGITGGRKQFLYGRNGEGKTTPYWQETFVVGKDAQKIPVKFSGTLLHRREEVIGCVCFFNDLREIKRLQKEMIENERLLAIGQTVAGLAHCIKNILVGMEAGVYVVEKGLRKSDIYKLQSGWDMVQRNIHQISSLSSDLLTYSKERKPRYESCAPNVIAEEVCELMEPRATESDIIMVRDFDPTIGDILLDPKGIYRCLMNQVSNAIDACIDDKDGSKKYLVKVSTRRESNGMMVFEVSDNGCGMDEETKNKIFTGFFSTKGSKGTGLGLIVTRKILQEHGGTISVRSEPGKGSTFTSKIPCERREDGAEQEIMITR